MAKPKVSLIIPVYNTETYLPSCFESIEAQSFQDFEVILVNDGSSDQSEQICLDYQRKHPETTTLYKQANLGQGTARNAGIQKATGEYVCFVDSDDLIDSTFLGDLIEAAELENADVVVSDLLKRYETSGNERLFKNILPFTYDMNINLMLSHPGPVAKLIRRSLIVDSELYFPQGRIYEDLLFNVTLGLKAQNVVYLPKANYIYRIREHSTMNTKTFNNKMEDIYVIFDSIMEILESYPLEVEYLGIEHVLYSATLRFLMVEGGLPNAIKNVRLIQTHFPHWKSNPYLKKRNLKFRWVCHLIFLRQFTLVRWLSKMRGV